MIIFLRILAVLGLALVSPVIFFSCLLILIEDGLPIFFVQNRVGHNEKVFRLLKIRTMHRETPSLGTHEIGVDNYLKCGKFLRNLKIDELPQVLNFIKGDINLVGPRPGLENQKELLIFRRSRGVHNFKPGITGLAQVLGYDMSNPELLSKIDDLYIQNRSMSLDIEIFFATFIRPIRAKINKKFTTDINNLM